MKLFLEDKNEEDEKKLRKEYQISLEKETKTEEITIPLVPSQDTLYAEIQDYNIEKVGLYLSEKAKEVREKYEEFRKNKGNVSISEIRDFVKHIPGLKQQYTLLQQHIHITEHLKKKSDSKEFRNLWLMERSMLESEMMLEEIEGMINNMDSMYQVLRLLCLQSVTNNGIKTKQYDFIRHEMVQTYGFEQVFLLFTQLEKLGLLRKKETLWNETSPYVHLRKNLRLIVDSNNMMNQDISYVTSGYAPLSVRIIESICKKDNDASSWNNIQETIRQIPGECNNVQQVLKEAEGRDSDEKKNEKKTMIVYYIGGITYMEISALRFIAKQIDCPYQIIIAASKITNGNTLLRSLSDKKSSRSKKSHSN